MQIWNSSRSSGLKTQKWDMIPKAKRMDEVMQGGNEGKGRQGENVQNRTLGPNYIATAGAGGGRFAREVSRGRLPIYLTLSTIPPANVWAVLEAGV